MTSTLPVSRSQLIAAQELDDPTPLRAILRRAERQGASDVHLVAGHIAMVRVDGELIPLATSATVPDGPLGSDDIRRLLADRVSEAEWDRVDETGDHDFALDVPDVGRFRVNLHRERGQYGAVLRAIPDAVPRLSEIGAPAALDDVARMRQGLVLVTGPTGSGKSTTLAAVLDEINTHRRARIVTIEDPIEFLHRNRESVISQREVGGDTVSFASALRHALRQDPDVLLVGEMRDLDTIRSAITAAETGHLVLATLHTHGAVEAVDRMIDVFPPEQQAQIRTQLASVLRVVVYQALLPRSEGAGRQLVAEVLTITTAVRSLIREAKTHQIGSSVLWSRGEGMVSFDQALAELVLQGAVSYRVAYEAARDPGELARLAGRPS